MARCLLVVLLLLLTACGGHHGDTSSSAGPGRFTLEVLPGGSAMGTADVGLQTRELPDGAVEVQVSAAGARELRGLFYKLRYDASRYTPVGAQFLNTLAPTDRLLSLSSFAAPGELQHGAVITGADGDGFSGSGVLAAVRFAARPFTGVRAASLAPRSERSRATLNFDAATLTLDWGYANQGDYDQNSEVNVADLSPLGSNFQASSGGASPFPAGSRFFMIDGDGNGELNIADLTPIGNNFQRSAASYNVYQSTNPDDIPASDSDPSTIAPLGSVNFEDGVPGPEQGSQKRFSFTIPELRTSWFYWVRPCDAPDGGGTEGLPSNVVSTGGDVGNVTPLASLSANPLSGDFPLSVNFDASGSSDPDGEIIQFAWDFDGDSQIDTTTTVPTVNFFYQQPGVFTARVLVTDDGAATESAQVAITVTDPGNAAPVAALTVTPESGPQPLDVQLDASASTDDGTLVNFEWDFEGDGEFDATTGPDPVVQHTYTGNNLFEPVVRVTDNLGITAAASASVQAGNANLPPVAVLDISAPDGEASPLRQLSAADSDDPDGTIVRYRWDFDGDGVFDQDSGNRPSVQTNYQQGIFKVVVEVTDNDDAIGSAQVILEVADANGFIPPVAKLFATPRSGTPPFEVSFDAGLSFANQGSIVSYQWDFENDGTVDETTAIPTTQFTFTVADQDKLASVTVVDSNGRTDEALLMIATDGNVGPDVQLTAEPRIGIDPHVVHFDASGSTDIDSAIEKYEWDLNGDFVMDEDTGAVPTLDHTFTTAGQASVLVKVTDSEGGVGTRSITIVTSDDDNVPPVAQLVVTVELNDSGGPPDVIFDASGSTDDGAIEFFLFDFDGDGNVNTSSSDPVVTLENFEIAGTLDARVTVFDDDGASDEADDTFTIESGFSQHLIDSGYGGGPVAAVTSGSASTVLGNAAYLSDGENLARFTRSTDFTGTDWNFPSPVLTGNGINSMALANVQQVKGFAFTESGGVGFAASTSGSGTSWNPALPLLASSTASGVALVIAAGNPAVAFVEGTLAGPDTVSFMRASNAAGSAWPAAAVPVATDDINTSRATMRMLVLDGIPTVFYALRALPCQVRLVRATSADGADWGAPFDIPGVETGLVSFDTAIVEGNPAIVFGRGELGAGPFYIEALDPAGATWGAPEPVATFGGYLGGARLRFSNRVPNVAYLGNSELLLLVRGDFDDDEGFLEPAIVAGFPDASDIGVEALLDMRSHPTAVLSDDAAGELRVVSDQ